MQASALLDYTYHTLVLVAMLSMPAVLTAAVVGLLIGFLQAVTQVNDAAIGQAAKLVATVLVLLITMRWIGNELLTFALQIFKNFPAIVR